MFHKTVQKIKVALFLGEITGTREIMPKNKNRSVPIQNQKP